MAIEIERKFLVRRESLPALPAGDSICQGYIQTLNRTTVRVRLRGDQAFLTLKGPANGISRSEFEYPIPVADAIQILEQLCTSENPAQEKTIEKTRYEIPHDDMTWELDIFSGNNAGLIVAEIELSSERQVFSLPDWVGEEVSSDLRYSNLALMQNPFSTWGA